ncbi:IS630 family transposase [Streptomyces cadmiisoli]|uniref:IS630 family transposase n=3 Tax=Streptomyces TaxID=1883 RepID=A0A2Z4IZW4_9ACTN|nr:IS630 family transposase [Streptomyces cadmiisoli]AWW36530.1 IS630 family transposase [Streptomyces cadmiisoli]AWW38350.1 IS630 family transposase [Streptomyces cadmiisoli]
MHTAAALQLREGDRSRLEALTRMSTAPAGLVQRARIVLLAADGVSNAQIASRLGTSRPTVLKWRDRYGASGIESLGDLPRPGRPGTVDEVAVLVATLAEDGRPPARLGVTHWSSRLLGKELGLSFSVIAKIWRKWGIQPHRVETFKFSTDPELEPKIRDVVGLYLAPPEKAVVVCVDEKTQIQALDRTAPILPLRPGLPERQTHDYRRNGTTSLFAALEVATGRISADACYERHTNKEFLHFLKQVAKAHPRVKLHVVVDNYATHKHPNVKAWLAKHPRVTLHFTPTSCSWLNMVEIFFGIITRQAIRRGTFESVPDLKAAIRAFIDGYNTRCEPFTWTKTADQILTKINRK